MEREDKVIKLNPEGFTWDKYIGTIGWPTSQVWDSKNNNPKEAFVLLGYADAEKLPVRPRKGYAVMLEEKETQEQFWLHI